MNMNRAGKKIMVFIDWYLPGYKAGGPIKSCVSLVERLKSFYDFRIVTTDTDLNEPLAYPEIIADKWTKTPKNTDVFYCSRSYLNLKNLEMLIEKENPDVIYLNSMFSPYFTLIPLLIVRRKKNKYHVVVAPRGMLSKGALAIKPVKKQLFLFTSKVLGLFKNVTFHASTEIEVDEIKNVFGSNAKVLHAINLTPDIGVEKITREKSANNVKLVYIGRISHVKNLMQCIEILSHTNPAQQYEFDIYGPHDDEEYLQACKNKIAQLPSHIATNFKGAVANDEISTLLKKYHFLFLLSMNENYGHAIVEAFTAGCPVIIGNRTPWKNLESNKCGWDLPLENKSEIISAVESAAKMNQHTYNEWSDATSEFAATIHNNIQTIEDHHRLFNAVS